MRNLKPFLCIATAFIAVGGAYFAGIHTARAQDPMGDVDRAVDAWDRQDKELNSVYADLSIHLGRPGSETRRRLVAAERAWVKYRDAQADFEALEKCPETSRLWPIENSKALESLTQAQIARFFFVFYCFF